jgi:hypothetical protein
MSTLTVSCVSSESIGQNIENGDISSEAADEEDNIASNTAQLDGPAFGPEENSENLANNEEIMVEIGNTLVSRREAIEVEATGRIATCKQCGRIISGNERRLRWPKKRAWGGVSVLTHVECTDSNNSHQVQQAIVSEHLTDTRQTATSLPAIDPIIQAPNIGREAKCILCGDIIRRGTDRLIWREANKTTHCHLACSARRQAEIDIASAQPIEPIIPRQTTLPQPATIFRGITGDEPVSGGVGEEISTSVMLNHSGLSRERDTSQNANQEFLQASSNSEAVVIPTNTGWRRFPQLILPKLDTTTENTELLWQARLRLLTTATSSNVQIDVAEEALWKFTFLPGLIAVDTQRMRQSARDREIKRRIRRVLASDESIFDELIRLSLATRSTRPSPVTRDEAAARNKKIERLILKGEISRACKSLDESGSMIMTDDIFDELKRMHNNNDDCDGILVNNVYESVNDNENGSVVITESMVKKAIKKLPSLSSSGPSGDSIDLWKYAAKNPQILTRLTDYISWIVTGNALPAVYDFITTTRMIAVPKKNNRPRPIAIGEATRRVAAATLLQACEPLIASAVGPSQFGVGVKGGTFKAINVIQTLLEKQHQLMAADISNAFGNIFRQEVLRTIQVKLPMLLKFTKCIYERETFHLVKREGGNISVIRASRGVDQGCPLSPLLFSACLAKAMQAARGSGVNVAYLDDTAVDVTNGMDSFERFASSCESMGLPINREKSHLLQPGNQQVILGAPAFYGENVPYKSADAFYTSLDKAMDNGLSHQASWVLATVCGGAKTAFQATFNNNSDDDLDNIEMKQRSVLARITGCDITEEHWNRAALPIRYGGLAATCVKESAMRSKIGSYYQSYNTVNALTGYKIAEEDNTRIRDLKRITAALVSSGSCSKIKDGIADEPQHDIAERQHRSKFEAVLTTLTTEDKAHLQSAAIGHSVNWLWKSGQAVSNEITSFALKTRLRIPHMNAGPCQLTSSNGSICNEQNDRHGDHVLRCLKGGHAVKAHNRIRDRLEKALFDSGYYTSTEELVPELPGAEQAIMDVVARDPTADKTIFIDVSIVHAVTGEQRSLTTRANQGGAAAARREYEKHRKYGACPAPAKFFPVVFETTGRLGRDAIKCLRLLAEDRPLSVSMLIGLLQIELLTSSWSRLTQAISMTRRRAAIAANLSENE